MTTYGRNDFYDRDQICLKSWARKGLNKLAIMNTMGTCYAFLLDKKGAKYAFNLESETDRICLQSVSIGTKFACNHQTEKYLDLN